MTLILKTESHGEVETGFYSMFTQFTRLGEKTFATRHLCELVQYLAENSNIHKARIFSYDLDKFWQRQEDNAQELIQMITEAEESYLPELQKSYIESWLEKQQGEIPLEDKLDLYNEKKLTPVKVSNDERSIKISEYIISAPYFRRFAIYLARGGFAGWMKDQEPKFAKPTIEAIKNSERKLFISNKSSKY